MARILAVSSGGGHWEQLMLLKGALDGHDVVFANTIPGLAEKSGIAAGHVISDCNRNQMSALLRCARDVTGLIIKNRPGLVITTGAAPGLIALMIGRLFGARTVWIDSVANSEKISMSGRVARVFAHLHVTQWQHLVPAGERQKTRFLGSLL